MERTAYAWLDVDVRPGVIYYYKLEDVDTYDLNTVYGPVSAAALLGTPHHIYLPLLGK